MRFFARHAVALAAAATPAAAQHLTTTVPTDGVINTPVVTVQRDGATTAAARVADPRYSTQFGTANNGVVNFSSFGMSNFDGVVRLVLNQGARGTFSCTGAAIGARAVLTAAHCLTDASGVNATVSATVQGIKSTGTLTSIATVAGANVRIRTGYTGAVVEERDLAVVLLDEDLPSWVTRYGIYDGAASDVLANGTPVVLSGFGRTGTVDAPVGNPTTERGDYLSNTGSVRRAGLNRFEATRNATQITTANTYGILWGDVDNGTAAADRTCNIFGGPAAVPDAFRPQLCNQGVDGLLNEVGIGRGDSGGAAFFNGQIVGVASFGESFSCTAPAPNPAPPGGRCVGAAGLGFGYTSLLNADNRAWVIATTVPEPSTYALLATGLVALATVARRRARRN